MPLEQLFDLVLVQHDRQHAVLEAVVVEDIGKAGGDDDAESPILEGPRRVLAAGAAAEIATRQQDARAFGFGPIQLEIGNDFARCVAGPIPE